MLRHLRTKITSCETVDGKLVVTTDRDYTVNTDLKKLGMLAPLED